MFTRRALLSALPLAACTPKPELDVAWLGPDPARAHRLREAVPTGTATQRRTQVLVVGAGVAGLSCARSLQRRGVEVTVLELDDAPGGNSRGGALAGLPCPLGAHYLPQPGANLPELQDLLSDIGLARRDASGRWQAAEALTVHAPAERRWDGQRWQAGLLPAPETPTAEDQQRRFAAAVREAQAIGFGLPTHRSDFGTAHRALDAQPFARWLDAQSLSDADLRWYLDYCCRDDYGAGLEQVSAWAGLHYFASRHGFHTAAGEDEEPAPPPLTAADGNAPLVRALGQGLRIETGRVALQLDEERHGVRVRCWTPTGLEDWQATHCVLAAPLFVAQRLCRTAAPALREARLQRAPWLVANLRLAAPLADRIGAPPAWDSVIQHSPTLGYVNASHQRLDPRPGPQVLTLYWALPQGERSALLQGSAGDWAQRVLAQLRPVHPDIDEQLRQVRLTRWGHAMAIPTPGARSQPALAALRQARGRVRFAHADLAAYSVFEEAFSAGLDAATALLPKQGLASPSRAALSR